jgi:hypothetical protein
MAFSAGTGIYLLIRGRKSQQPPADEEGAGGDSSPEYAHPIIVFAVDAILAASLITVLVFTWIGTGTEHWTSEMAMLAGYATIPLLVNL